MYKLQDKHQAGFYILLKVLLKVERSAKLDKSFSWSELSLSFAFLKHLLALITYQSFYCHYEFPVQPVVINDKKFMTVFNSPMIGRYSRMKRIA